MIVGEIRGRTRAQIVRLRCIAMRDGSARAIEFHAAIEAELARDPNVASKVAVALLKAEILHLDGDDAQALKVFQDDITQYLADLSSDFEIIVRHNYNDVQAALWSPGATREFYDLVDHQRIARFSPTNSSAILGAKNAAALGKHYDALPDLWNELRRTYGQGCWRAHRWALQDFADECLQLGWPDEACQHAILAQDESSAKRAGEQLIALQQSDRIIKALKWMLANANLKRHFTIACDVIVAIADAVPDSEVPLVYEWAATRAAAEPNTPIERNAIREAWTVLAAIAHRLDERQAVAAVNLATSHSWWMHFDVDRNRLRQVVGRCVNGLPVVKLAPLAQDVIGHIVNRHEDHDYEEAVNLICHIAGVGGESLRNDIAEKLYEKGTKLTAALVQVAPLFKKESALAEALEPWARQVTNSLPSQVQRLAPGEEPTPCNESFMYRTTELPDGAKQIVHFVGTVALHSALVHRHSLLPATLDALMQAMLAMLEDRDNFLGNKVGLLKALSISSDSVGTHFATEVFRVVAPFARGDIREPEGGMSAADADNPLNRFKMGMGKPSDLQAIALYTLAKIEHARPGAFGADLEAILEDAISNAHPEVRYMAFYSWRFMPRLPASVQTSLILGTRDPDQSPATAAYDTIARCETFHPTSDELKVLCQSVSVSINSRSTEVRRVAATACKKLAESAPDGPIKSKFLSLQCQFKKDICFSVREAASSLNC